MQDICSGQTFKSVPSSDIKLTVIVDILHIGKNILPFFNCGNLHYKFELVIIAINIVCDIVVYRLT